MSSHESHTLWRAPGLDSFPKVWTGSVSNASDIRAALRKKIFFFLAECFYFTTSLCFFLSCLFFSFICNQNGSKTLESPLNSISKIVFYQRAENI